MRIEPLRVDRAGWGEEARGRRRNQGLGGGRKSKENQPSEWGKIA
jgi:hypothetical protein